MKKIFLISVWLIINSHGLFSQIKGKIIEVNEQQDSLPVIGASLFWLHTTIGTLTDDKGQFSLPLNHSNHSLVIKALGYSADTLLIQDTLSFLIIRIRSGIDLNEVEIEYVQKGTEITYLNPMKIETINERELTKAACCNLSESFETNPSIDVNFADAVSGTKQIQMLGLSGQYAQMTKENMPYLRGLANNYGLTFIPGTWIQSIQLSKGAGSVINGYESFTGQINTELQNPSKSDRVNLNVYGNANGRNEYNLNLSHRFNEIFSSGLLAHLSYNPLAQDMNGDHFADIPIGRQINLMNKYAIHTKKGFEAQLGGGYIKDNRTGGQFATFFPGAKDSVPLYKIGIDNEKWELYSKTGFVFRKKVGNSLGLQLSYLQHRQNNVYGTNLYHGSQATFYANFIYQGMIKTTDHVYKAGISYMDDQWNETFNWYQYHRKERVGGIFAEYAFNLKDKFNLVAGLRADYHNYYGLFFTPRLHARYARNESKTIFRASAGRALRTANIFADNLFLMASSRQWNVYSQDFSLPYGLKPEIGWNYGINFTQKMILNYRDAYITVDLYRTDFKQQVIIDVDQNTQEVNIYNLKGTSYSNTAQIEFGWEIRKRLNMKTAYRFVDTKMTYLSGILQKPLISKHRAFLNLSYETKKKRWQFDATVQYNGKKRLPQTRNNPDEYKRKDYSPYFFNVLGQVSYWFKIKKAENQVYIGVENLLNYKQTNPIVSSSAPYSPYFDASMVWGSIYGRMLYVGWRMKIK